MRVFCLVFFVFSLQAREFLTFDNKQSITQKVEYGIKYNLKGFMAWQIAQDSGGELSTLISSFLPEGKEFAVYFPSYVTKDIRNYQVIDLKKILQAGVKISTVVYCFAKPELNGTVTIPEIPILEKLKELRTSYKGLKVTLSLGGWTYKEQFLSICKSGKIAILAKNLVDVLIQYDLDGVDIDWEYLSNEEFEAFKNNVEPFLKLLSEEMRKRKVSLLVTFAVMPGRRIFSEYKRVKELSELVDRLYLMTYNYTGSWAKTTGHTAPLYSSKKPYSCFLNFLSCVSDYIPFFKTTSSYDSVDASIKGFLSEGIPSDKLVMGICYHGRSFKDVEPGPQNDGLYQKHGGKGNSFSLIKPGTFDYATIKNHIPHVLENHDKESDFSYYWDDQCKVPYLYSKS